MSSLQMRTWIVSADLVNVNLICSDISIWLVERNLTGHLFPLELLAREALNNAIIHGCQTNPAMQVYAELECDENTLSLTIRDEGIGFDWQGALQDNVFDDDRENGRGLKLYRLYADRVEFNDRGNQVILIRSLRNRTLFKSFQEKSEGK